MCSSMIMQEHNQATTALPAACQEEGGQQGGASACCLTHSSSISCPKTVSMEEGNQQATALRRPPIRNPDESSIKQEEKEEEEEEEEEAEAEAVDMLFTTTEQRDNGDLTNGAAASPSRTAGGGGEETTAAKAVDMLSTIAEQRDDDGDLINGAPPSPSGTVGERETDLSVMSSIELRQHCKPGDVWISIHGKVYDVSRWLSSHPGGAKLLLAMAGKDATDAFLAFHPPGTGSAILPGLLVATLSDYEVSPLSADYRQTLATLRQAGLFRTDLSPYLLLATVLLAMFCLSLAGVLLVRHGFLLHMASAALLGLVWSQTSFIMHDYAHSPFLRNPSLNLWLQTFIANCLTGLSPSWWKKSHNAHHACTNDLSRDPDLQFIPFFAVSSSFFSSLYSHYHERRMSFNSAARLLVSYQHWTFYPVMLIARINLFLQAFVFFLSGEKMQSKAMEIGGIVCFWAWFLALLACLPDWKERLGFLLVSSATTSVQHLQFCLNHFSCEVEEGADDDGHGGHGFLMSQLKGTLNIECPPWMDWFHGGLQFQLEHHLFPRLPRHNLRKVSGAVRALCEKHGLRYESVGFWEANRMLFRTLHAAAMEARKL